MVEDQRNGKSRPGRRRSQGAPRNNPLATPAVVGDHLHRPVLLADARAGEVRHRGSMERNESGTHALFCATLVVLFAAGGLDRAKADESQTSIGEVPLCDLGTGTFEGVLGGLYANGTSVRPAGHEAAGIAIASREVIPRDPSGTPSPDGKIVLI